MSELEDNVRKDLIDAILAYFEGEKSFRSVIVLGITAQNKSEKFSNITLKSIVERLSLMGDQIGKGKQFSKEQIRLAFTEYLDELTKD
jgi:hypothetical protein